MVANPYAGIRELPLYHLQCETIIVLIVVGFGEGSDP